MLCEENRDLVPGGTQEQYRAMLAVIYPSDGLPRRLPGTTSEVVAFCASLAGPTRAAYQAGPTGYGLARALQAVGVGCVVAAPGKIERPAARRGRLAVPQAPRPRHGAAAPPGRVSPRR